MKAIVMLTSFALLLVGQGNASLEGTPEDIVQSALGKAGYEGGWLDEAHRQYLATFMEEHYNDEDGLVQSEILEALRIHDHELRYRSDHKIRRPALSPETLMLSFHRVNYDMWEVTRNQDTQEMEAKSVVLNAERLRIMPLQHVSYYVTHPDQYTVTYIDQGDDSLGVMPVHIVDIDIRFDSDSLGYRFYVETNSGLPCRVECSDGFVVDYKDWKEFGSCMIPSQVSSAMLLVGRQASHWDSTYWASTRLVDIDFSPEFDDDYFELPACISRHE